MSDTGELEKGPEDDVEMGFFEHLAELRNRLIRAIYGIVPCIAVCWLFKEYLLEAMLDRRVEVRRGRPLAAAAAAAAYS